MFPNDARFLNSQLCAHSDLVVAGISFAQSDTLLSLMRLHHIVFGWMKLIEASRIKLEGAVRRHMLTSTAALRCPRPSQQPSEILAQLRQPFLALADLVGDLERGVSLVLPFIIGSEW